VNARTLIFEAPNLDPGNVVPSVVECRVLGKPVPNQFIEDFSVHRAANVIALRAGDYEVFDYGLSTVTPRFYVFLGGLVSIGTQFFIFCHGVVTVTAVVILRLKERSDIGWCHVCLLCVLKSLFSSVYRTAGGILSDLALERGST